MQRPLTLSCGEYKRTRPLLDGRIRLEGFDLRILPDPFPPQGMLPDYQHIRNQRMHSDKAFDICEMGMAPYLSARDAGAPLIAIPVFHYRRFRHRYIFCRDAANLHEPRDLIGRRIGIRRLNLSAGVWARGLLEHEYGVPLETITWVLATDVPLRQDARSRLRIHLLPPGQNLLDLLAGGKLDAIVEASDPTSILQGLPRIRPLLGEDTTQIEIDYYSRTGIFPIMHTVVLWSHVAQRLPDIPKALHRAFVTAKVISSHDPDMPERYILAEEERRWWNSLGHDQKQIMHGDPTQPRDPWVYSVQEDRNTVETFLDYAYEQGLTSVRYAIEDLFAPSTLEG